MKINNYTVILTILIASVGCNEAPVGYGTVQYDAKIIAYLQYERQQIFKNNSSDHVSLKLEAAELFAKCQQLRLVIMSKYTTQADSLKFQTALAEELKILTNHLITKQ